MEIDITHKDLPEDDSWRQKLPAGNPFGVPAGYFDDLSERIISGVHLENFKRADTPGGFTVPENYFDNLSSNIQSRITIEKAAASDATGFTVPPNYFEELSSNIQSRIAIEHTRSNSTESFTVPDGYFDELSSNIQSRIAIEQALNSGVPGFTVPNGYFEELSNNIQSRIALPAAADNAFTVPEGYFNGLQQNILNQTAEADEAKIVQMPSRQGIIRKLVSSAAFKYASAACFAIIVGLAVYLKETPVSHDNSYLHKELSEVPADEIRSFLENQTEAVQTERKVIADGTELDHNALRTAIQDYVDVQ